MQDKKYLLCVKMKNPKTGEFEWYEIANASLTGLTKYTTYCTDANQLFNLLPNKEPSFSKTFLKFTLKILEIKAIFSLLELQLQKMQRQFQSYIEITLTFY